MFSQHSLSNDFCKVLNTGCLTVKYEVILEMALLGCLYIILKIVLKGLIEKRQKALAVHVKDSQVYKHWRAKVQRECKICKRNYYNNKIAALKDTNVQRWWKEIKRITGRKDSHDWFYQMLNDTITSLVVLGQFFNTSSANLTAHFTPLGTSLTTSVLDAPREFLVGTRETFRALNQVKLNKCPGSDVVPNKTWKEFAWDLPPVLSDIYNTSLRQGVAPSQLKESQVPPCPKCTIPETIKNDLRPNKSYLLSC